VTIPEARLPEALRAGFDTSQDLVVSTQRIRSELGHQETVPRAEAIRRTIEWERANSPGEIELAELTIHWKMPSCAVRSALKAYWVPTCISSSPGSCWGGELLKSTDQRAVELLRAARKLGMEVEDIQVLADAGNLIARLLPYPIVARVSTLFGDEDPVYWRNVLAREVKVSLHLKQQGVPVVVPTNEANPGPHPVGDTWFSLWEYVPPVHLSDPSPHEALHLLRGLEAGMLTYPGALPLLGAWAPVSEFMAQLLKTDDKDIRSLAEFWRTVDRQLSGIPGEQLTAAHGDAHLGNLIPGPSGWLWTDFEDSSLMPKFWDLAAAVGRTFLLGEARGTSESLIRGVLGEQPDGEQLRAFSLALAARAILSISSNLALALHGHSDLVLARRRLDNGLKLLEQLCSGQTSLPWH